MLFVCQGGMSLGLTSGMAPYAVAWAVGTDAYTTVHGQHLSVHMQTKLSQAEARLQRAEALVPRLEERCSSLGGDKKRLTDKVTALTAAVAELDGKLQVRLLAFLVVKGTNTLPVWQLSNIRHCATAHAPQSSHHSGTTLRDTDSNAFCHPSRLGVSAVWKLQVCGCIIQAALHTVIAG